jgi:hypothetical protein
MVYSGLDLQPEAGCIQRYKQLPLGGDSMATTITGANITYSATSITEYLSKVPSDNFFPQSFSHCHATILCYTTSVIVKALLNNQILN